MRDCCKRGRNSLKLKLFSVVRIAKKIPDGSPGFDDFERLSGCNVQRVGAEKTLR